jgi:hypothetical protein
MGNEPSAAFVKETDDFKKKYTHKDLHTLFDNALRVPGNPFLYMIHNVPKEKKEIEWAQNLAWDYILEALDAYHPQEMKLQTYLALYYYFQAKSIRARDLVEEHCQGLVINEAWRTIQAWFAKLKQGDMVALDKMVDIWRPFRLDFQRTHLTPDMDLFFQDKFSKNDILGSDFAKWVKVANFVAGKGGMGVDQNYMIEAFVRIWNEKRINGDTMFDALDVDTSKKFDVPGYVKVLLAICMDPMSDNKQVARCLMWLQSTPFIREPGELLKQVYEIANAHELRMKSNIGSYNRLADPIPTSLTIFLSRCAIPLEHMQHCFDSLIRLNCDISYLYHALLMCGQPVTVATSIIHAEVTPDDRLRRVDQYVIRLAPIRNATFLRNRLRDATAALPYNGQTNLSLTAVATIATLVTAAEKEDNSMDLSWTCSQLVGKDRWDEIRAKYDMAKALGGLTNINKSKTTFPKLTGDMLPQIGAMLNSGQPDVDFVKAEKARVAYESGIKPMW